MYGIDLSVQIENLMPALGLGFLLGFVYDAVRFLRLLLSEKKIVLFVSDMLFVVFCAFASFLLLLGINNGNIRLYLILAEITGAVVYFCTASIAAMSVYRKTAGIIKKAFKTIFYPFMLLKKKISVLIKKLYGKFCEIMKKIKNKFKKPLKDETEMLYNYND